MRRHNSQHGLTYPSLHVHIGTKSHQLLQCMAVTTVSCPNERCVAKLVLGVHVDILLHHECAHSRRVAILGSLPDRFRWAPTPLALSNLNGWWRLADSRSQLLRVVLLARLELAEGLPRVDELALASTAG